MAGADGDAAAERPVSAWDDGALGPALARWAGAARPGDYVAILAFLAPDPATDRALGDLRRWFRDWRGLAATVGTGPRFLHSSGQLHKGGPATGLFLQVVDEITDDVPVPQTPHGFRALLSAQARGDAAALRERGRRVLSVDVGRDVPAGLARLRDALSRFALPAASVRR
jgi:transaldolase/glucose-6-phosphate isomerase